MAPRLRAQSSMVEKAWQLERETAGHTVSVIKKLIERWGGTIGEEEFSYFTSFLFLK